jgi:hypothetical protein
MPIRQAHHPADHGKQIEDALLGPTAATEQTQQQVQVGSHLPT